jgi:transposase
MNRIKADVLGTSISIYIRRFKGLVEAMPTGVQFPRVIAIDEYKADTDSGTYQSIIAGADTYLEEINNTSKVLKRQCEWL